jgi:enoyl-CoA hydratase
MSQDTDVLFDVMLGLEGNLGIITLNRPTALNALTHNMILAMQNHLIKWEQDKNIKAVVIKAVEGKAFCAGGDIKSVYQAKHKQHDFTAFFKDEYRLNKFIFHYSKPYIAILNGITMGGGVGISLHGSHRIATENLVFAMPETGIGFFPDVGGTYFLPRMPHYIGYYLGLCGTRINSNDCIALNIAHHKIAVTDINRVIKAIAETSFHTNARESVTKIISDYSQSNEPSTILANQELINQYFSKDDIESIMQALKTSDNNWCEAAADSLAKKSPTSLKVTLRALKIGANLNFDECMQQEFRLVSHFLQAHDFSEGIRALLIDKDQKPQWKPAKLDEVTNESVLNFFSPVSVELS